MGKKTGDYEWQESADAVEVVASAKEAIAGIIQMGNGVLEEHKKILISRMIWKITEANGKYNTRYLSEKALKASKNDRRHDHVWTRKQMVARILKNPNVLEREIKRATGCTVTKSEHDDLTKYDKDYDGWDRYKEAGIRVWDQEKRVWISDAWK
jgi:hypothetical protein